jgi:hypothetical protein
MSLLLMMGGSDTPNTRSLFANNEAGLALDVGDRYGASESKRTWRRNLWTYSSEFGNAVWTKTRCSVTENADDSPVGIGTADELIENTDNNTHILSRVASCEVATYTLSVYAKSDGRNWFSLMNGTLVGIVGHFDLANGVVGTVGGSCTADMEDAGGGWWRCWITFTASSGNNEMRIRLGNADNSPTYLGDGASGILIDGFQLEKSSTPTDYQRITDFNTEFKAAYPTHSLYVDSNGVAPAVYPGDQVGLILDTSRGGLDNLGPELVTNGGFDSDTWWTKSTNVTISGGLANYNTVALNNGVFRSGVVTAGKFYVVTFTVASFSSGGVRVYTGGNRTSAYAATGTYRVFCLAGSSDTQIIFEATSAGTVLTLDNISVREIPGNHAYQTTSGSRPALARTPDGGRRNLIVNSEFSGSGTPTSWTAFNTGGTATIVASTAGYSNAIEFVTASSGLRQIMIQGFTTLPNSTYTVSFQLEAVSGTTRSVASWGTTPAGATLTSLINPTTPGRYSMTITTGATGGTAQVRLGIDVSGDLTATACTVRISGVQVELGTETAYQRVTLTSDVTESGKRDCWALLFDGSDDNLASSAIDFSGTDKMVVMAGVRKNTDALSGMLCELSALASSNNGAFNFSAPRANNEDSYAITTNGVSAANLRSYTGNAAPRTDVLSFSLTTNAANSSAAIAARQNGASVAGIEVLTAASSGNFGNYSLFIGSRNSASVRFNGLIYTLIVRGATTPTGTIADFERNLLAKRAGITF